VARSDPWKQINRLLDEVGVLQRRIVDGVRRDGKSIEQVRTLERQVATRKAQIRVLKDEYLAELAAKPQIEGTIAPGETPMTVEEAMIVAATLKTQRPRIYSTEEWPAFRRVCVSLSELFAARLAGASTPFGREQFLIACGLPFDDASRLASAPGTGTS
jgi:hypothetical protein